MAYTRTPEFNSHQVKRLPVVGSHTLPSFLQTGTGMKYYNCMPRKVEQYGTDPISILEKIPYWTPAASTEFPAAAVGKLLRGAWRSISPSGVPQYHLVCDSTWYLNGTSVATLVGTSGYVGFCDATIAGTHYVVALETHATASRVHSYNTTAGTVTTVNLTIGAQGDPVFHNGRIYFSGYRTQRIYNSNVGSTTSYTISTDFIDAEMVGDSIVSLAKHRNHVVALGIRSVEFFYDSAVEYGSPLQRQESYANLIGATYLYPDTNARYMSVSIGNDTYFNGTVDGANGIYRIRDFKITKVSDAYLDRIMNNGSRVIYNSGLFSAVFNGMPVLCFSTYTPGDISSYGLYALNLEDSVWTQCSLPNSGTYDIMPKFAYSDQNVTVVFGDEFTTGTVYARKWISLNEDKISPTGSTVTSYMIFDTFDGGNELQKHFKYVDVIGDMGDNTVTLTFTKESSKESTTYTSSNDSAGDPIRFRNLCRAKRINLKVGFSGKTQIEFRGLDVAYNQGTV